VAQSWVASPFASIPLPNLNDSSFGVIPKKGQPAIVQAFYRQKSANLPLIAKEDFSTDVGPGTCPL